MIHSLNGATIFSKLDLNKGYHQIELDESCCHITTFTTHKGLYRYKGLNFDVCFAAEHFQKIIQQTLEGIISDDTVVFGNSKAEHDKNIESFRQKLNDKNLTLNCKKSESEKSKLEFIGFTFSKYGVAAQKAKIKAIKNASIPKSPSKARSLLGLANYCARLIKYFDSITESLRALNRKNTKWNCTLVHDKALSTLTLYCIAYHI